MLAGLPNAVDSAADAAATLERGGQIRLWWKRTPIDAFLDTTDFHRQAAGRVRWETLLDRRVPFLACGDLAVFEAFFDRTQDWADLEAMRAAGTLDIDGVISVLVRYLGADDTRVPKLEALR